MHIPDGFIDLPTSLGAAAIAAPSVVLATRRAGRQLSERHIPLAGLVVAYLVVAQLLVFPIGLGTGAHLLGTGLALVLVGPWVAHACVAVVLILQALVLADGGISALGLNTLNNALVPLMIGTGVLVATRPWWRASLVGGPTATATHRSGRPSRSAPAPRVAVVAGIAAAAGAFGGAVAFCVEFALGGTDALSPELVTIGFLGAHAVVAVIEGVLTGLVVAALSRSRPDLILRWWPVPVPAETQVR
jgi:cobalt/nickel transport system permease protein